MSFPLGTKTIPREGLTRIMIRGTNWLGDVVMSLPAVAAIRHTYPAATISVLAKPWVADLYRLCPAVDEVIVYHRPGRHDGIRGMLRLAGQLRKRKFQLAILLQNAIEAAIIATLAGIPLRAGYNTDGRGFLLTNAVPRNREIDRQHQCQYYLHLAAELGCLPGGEGPLLNIAPASREAVSEMLTGIGVSSQGPLIGLAVGAAFGPAKKWSPERFAAVADRLAEQFNAQILVLGSKDDNPQAEAVGRFMKHRMFNLAGRTGLADAIALIERLDLMIANDSGLMHIAGVLDVPTLAIFGPTNPVATSPLGRKIEIVHKAVDCSPCRQKSCPTDFRCLDSIGVEDVYPVAVKLLDRKAGVARL